MDPNITHYDISPPIITASKKSDDGIIVESYLNGKRCLTVRHHNNGISGIMWETDAEFSVKLSALCEFLSIYSNVGVQLQGLSPQVPLEQIAKLPAGHENFGIGVPQASAGWHKEKMYCSIREGIIRPVWDCMRATSAPRKAEPFHPAGLYAALRLAYSIRPA